MVPHSSEAKGAFTLAILHTFTIACMDSVQWLRFMQLEESNVKGLHTKSQLNVHRIASVNGS